MCSIRFRQSCTPEQGAARPRGVTFGVAGDHDAVEWAEEIVNALDGKPLRIEADRLGSYHAGAVMSSNALVAVIDAAVVLMKRAGIEEQAALKALEPIARASLENISPLGAQDGPDWSHRPRRRFNRDSTHGGTCDELHQQ